MLINATLFCCLGPEKKKKKERKKERKKRKEKNQG